jgi:hypothetical protein
MTIKNIIFAAGSIASIQPNLLSTTYFNFETTYGTGNFTLGTPAQYGVQVVASRLSFSNVAVSSSEFVGATQTGTGKQGALFLLYRNGSTTTWLPTGTNSYYLGNSTTVIADYWPASYNSMSASEDGVVVAGMSTYASVIQTFKYSTSGGLVNVGRGSNLAIMRPSSASMYSPTKLIVSPNGQWIAYGSPNVNTQLNTANSRGSVGLWYSTDGFTTFPTSSYIVPTDATANGFGLGLAIGGNSNVMAISEANTSSKRVFIYNRSGTTWSQQQIVSKPTITNGLFGYNMDISKTASRMAITESLANVGGFTNTGQVHIYSNVAGTWQAEAVIQPSGTGLASGMQFGTYVLKFDEDGQTLLVSAQGAYGGSGGGFIYKRGGGNTWNLTSNLTAQLLSPSSNSVAGLGISGTLNYAGTEVLLGAFTGNTTSATAKGSVFYYNLS